MIEMEMSRRGFTQTMAVGAAALSALGLAGATPRANAGEATGEVDPYIPDYVAAGELPAQEPKKIAVLLGAGQDVDLGNTSKLVYEFARGAREMGHEVTTFMLGNMDIHPCLGCGHCRQSEVWPTVRTTRTCRMTGTRRTAIWTVRF